LENEDKFPFAPELSKDYDDEREIKVKQDGQEIKTLPKGRTIEELDRDLAEMSADLEFLKEQVDCDMEHYSVEALKYAREKIRLQENKAASLRAELEMKDPNKDSE
jgi:hypothetical protein